MTTHAGQDDGLTELRNSIAKLGEKAPFASDIVAAFGELAVARARFRAGLAQPPLPEARFDPERFSQGIPALRDQDLAPLAGPFLDAAASLMPEMARIFPSIAEELARIGQALRDRPELARTLAAALVAGGRSEDVAAMADDIGVGAETLEFAAVQALKPCLERQAEALAELLEDCRWHRGYCSICGSSPDLAFLRPKEPEPTEFLISKSGQLWLHCPQCAHRWRFARVTCPHCGSVDHETFTSYAADGREDERFYACGKCKRYFPCIDLVEQADSVPLDLAPLGLVHLDLLAQKKGFEPLARLPWNQFS